MDGRACITIDYTRINTHCPNESSSVDCSLNFISQTPFLFCFLTPQHPQIDPKECNLKNGVRLKRDSNQLKVFVGGLPHDIKEDVLKDFFSNYGNVTEVVIMKDQEKKKGRGKGFTYSIDNSIGYDLLPIII